jgi:c-di-GMP-binding flagellar brake protein YcgR
MSERVSGEADRNSKYLSAEVNDLLQVKVLDDPNSLTYRSRVDDLPEGMLVISWPTERGVRIPIHENQPLSLSFVRDSGVFTFSAVVDERWQYPIPQVRVRPTSTPERIQRRQFFRVKAALAVELTGTLPPGETDDRGGNFVHVRTFTYDISGSGVAIRHSDPLPPGTLLETKLTIPGELAAVKALSKVVNSDRISSSTDKVVFHIGMYFLSISESERSRIVRHVFRVQQTALSG